MAEYNNYDSADTDGNDSPFQYPNENKTINSKNATYYKYQGTYYLMAPRGASQTNDHKYFYYYAENPSGEGESLQAMRREKVKFKKSGGAKLVVDGHWLIKMPDAFRLSNDPLHQVGNSNPEAENWQVGGTYNVTGGGEVKTFLALRSWDYAKAFSLPRTRYSPPTTAKDIREVWLAKLDTFFS